MLVRIKTVKAQKVRHAFGLSDGSSRGENGNDGTSDLDVLRASEGFECKLGEIRTEADLAEIEQDYEAAMLVLSDALHEFIAANSPAPTPLRQRIQDLTELRNQPGGTPSDD